MFTDSSYVMLIAGTTCIALVWAMGDHIIRKLQCEIFELKKGAYRG